MPTPGLILRSRKGLTREVKMGPSDPRNAINTDHKKNHIEGTNILSEIQRSTLR